MDPDSVIDIDNSHNQASQVSFSKVPRHLHQSAKEGYTPSFVSLGPFHRSEPWLLQSMEHKRRYLTCLLRPSINQPVSSNQVITLDTLNEGIKNLQISSRETYPDLAENISDEEFVNMLVLDGCFVIQLIRFFNQAETHDPIFRTRWMVPTLQDDLLLLENQIPYTVLQKLFDLTDPLHEEASLSKLILKFLGLDEYLQQPKSGSSDHLLGLIHSSFISSVTSPRSRKRLISNSYSYAQPPGAVEIVRNGILIRVKTNVDLLNLELKNSTLRIPHLVIDNSFIIAMRNFVAYEQCNKNVKLYFTLYVNFLAGLIRSSEDVKLLCERRIISYTMSSEEEVANLVNSLTNKVSLDLHETNDDYLLSLTQQIHNFCYKPWNLWRSRLMRDYFPDPQSTITVLAVYLAIIQTVFSVVSVIISLQQKK